MTDELWECFSQRCSRMRDVEFPCNTFNTLSFPPPHTCTTTHATMAEGSANTLQAELAPVKGEAGRLSPPRIRRLDLESSLVDSPVGCFVSSCVFFIHWSVEVSAEGRVTPKINMLTKIPEKGEMLLSCHITTVYLTQAGIIQGKCVD